MPLPREMLAEIARVPRVLWIEQGIDQFASFLGWRDFSYDGPRSRWVTIKYRSLERRMLDWLQCYVTDPGSGAEIFSTVSDLAQEIPFAWRRDNVHYLSALDFYDPYMMTAFVDFLNKSLAAERVFDFGEKRAMLRIEDVSPLVRADAVQGVIDVASTYDIPYAIAVIPVAVSGTNRQTMKDNPELLELLRRAQANGASIIMHGYEHQNDFSPKTGEGWEFWNARDDRPMDDDEAFTRDRLEKSFLELARNGLYPVAFEAPHYAMSKKGYDVLSEYFNVYSGVPQISDESYHIGLTLPFAVKSPYLNGMTLLPENMGYYDGAEFTIEGMLQNGRNLLDLERPFACFFYHGYRPADNLHRAREGAQDMGYTFFDLRALDIRAGSERVKIRTEDGELRTWVEPALLEQWRIEDQTPPAGAMIRTIAWGQTVLVALVILVFLILIVRLRRNARKKYEVQ
jgi:hypothetical protein